MKTTAVTTLVLAALTLTGCTANTSAPEAATSSPVAASTAPSSTYIELDGDPTLTSSEQIEDEALKARIADARSTGSPLVIQGADVFWLTPQVSYAEREIVEAEAKDAGQGGAYPVRGVEGIGTGEITLYRHDADPYSIDVATGQRINNN